MLSSRSIRSGVRASERRRERKEKARQELALFEFACMATAFTSTAPMFVQGAALQVFGSSGPFHSTPSYRPSLGLHLFEKNARMVIQELVLGRRADGLDL
jgi:hypothetical protein